MKAISSSGPTLSEPVPAPGQMTPSACGPLEREATRKQTERQHDAVAQLPAASNPFARWWRHPFAMHYNRLAVLCWAVNVTLLCWYGSSWFDGDAADLAALSTMVMANLTLAVAVRQQRVINGLFWLATRASTRWPLWLRWNLGKVYHLGGLHSGGTVAATVWFALFEWASLQRLQRGLAGVSLAVVAIGAVLLALLILVILCAQPAFRRRHHNGFELVHRFVGWGALLLVWLQSVLFIADQQGSGGFLRAALAAPALWMLALVTLSVISPWLTLRRVPIHVVTPSPHAAIVTLDDGARAFPGSTTALSISPLAEWHSFANIPAPGTHAYRIIISRSGDWTGQFINQPPRHIWIKGIITAGVANIETLFSKVLYVATGSGIGPVLPHLIGRRVPTALIWATREPRKTYGDAIVDEILEHQPDALIWDTDTLGKPDLSLLAWQGVHQHAAEAVIVISNQSLTEKVVWDLESRGIPAFGAIFDS